MSRPFSIGDDVFDFRHGYGKVVRVHTASPKVDVYNVEVKFFKNFTQSYTPDGKWHYGDYGPSLFHADEIPGKDGLK